MAGQASNVRVERVPDLTPGGRLARIHVRGVRPPGLQAGVTSGTLSLSTSSISTLELAIPDQNLEVLGSGVYAVGAPISYGAIPLTVVSSEIADNSGIPTLTMEAGSRGAVKVKTAKGELVRRDLSPTDWVRLGASNHGLDFVGQPFPKRPSITRPGPRRGQAAQHEWDFWQSLAGDVGAICFESMGVVYFAEPSWLVDHLPKVEVHYGPDGRLPVIPTCRRTSADTVQPVTVDLLCADSLADQLLPGVCGLLDGIPTFNHHYLVTGCRIPIDDTQFASVQMASPKDPAPGQTGKEATAAINPPPKTKTKAAS